MTSALHRIRIAVAMAVAVCCLLGPAAAAHAAETEATSVLFALDADEGSLVPVKGKKGTFTLTLRKVNARALAFDDRPGRNVGTIRVQKLIDELFVSGQAPPNAAVNAEVDGDQALMGVQLNSPRYSARTRTLRFRARQLVQEPGAAPDSRVDTVLPRRFGHTALFIDNCCGAASTGATVFNTSTLDMVVQINNGAQFGISGTGPFAGWTPQQPTSGGPTFNQAGPPAPGVLAPGVNYLTITPSGSVESLSFPIEIPQSVRFTSLQLYLSFNASGTVAWTLTNNGTYVTGSVTQGAPVG